MEMDDFAAMTKRVIVRDGFAGYQPTACFPERQHVAVLAGVPDSVEVERVALQWAASKAREDEEFLVAFKLDEQHFKIVRRSGSGLEHRVYSASTE